ncbi:hypothetical protein [Nonomuraea sp. NPDC050643]|uniref:hypothetical protein n=1 Tax=Nonomuraea sp. NPDC050643 TaxID=3155660 RepID=UPI0033E99C3E
MKLLSVVIATVLAGPLITPPPPAVRQHSARPPLCSLTSVGVGELVNTCRVIKDAGL